MANMNEHVQKLFPDWQHEMSLLANNENFIEVCGDYQEMATWLLAAEDDPMTPRQLEDARLLLGELEDELRRMLQSVRDRGA